MPSSLEKADFSRMSDRARRLAVGEPPPLPPWMDNREGDPHNLDRRLSDKCKESLGGIEIMVLRSILTLQERLGDSPKPSDVARDIGWDSNRRVKEVLTVLQDYKTIRMRKVKANLLKIEVLI